MSSAGERFDRTTGAVTCEGAERTLKQIEILAHQSIEITVDQAGHGRVNKGRISSWESTHSRRQVLCERYILRLHRSLSKRQLASKL